MCVTGERVVMENSPPLVVCGPPVLCVCACIAGVDRFFVAFASAACWCRPLAWLPENSCHVHARWKWMRTSVGHRSFERVGCSGVGCSGNINTMRRLFRCFDVGLGVVHQVRVWLMVKEDWVGRLIGTFRRGRNEWRRRAGRSWGNGRECVCEM